MFFKKKIGVSLAIVLILITFIYFGFYYTNTIYKTMTREVQETINEVTNQRSNVASKQLEHDFDILRVFSTGQISYPDVNIKTKMKRLSDETDSGRFEFIGLVDKQGIALTTDGEKLDVSNEDFFKICINGERYISYLTIDDDINLLMAHPIYWNEEITGVLYGGYKIVSLIELINHESNGVVYIIDDLGNIVAHPQLQNSGHNLFEQAKKENNKINQIEYMKLNIALNKTGIAMFKLNSQKRYIGYSPISKIDNWCIVTSVPEDEVMYRTKRVLVLSLFFVSLLSLALTAVIIFILRSRKQLADIAYKDTLTGSKNFEKFIIDAKEYLKAKKLHEYAMVYLDIKHFKFINNDFGYEIGDKILCNIAEKLNLLLKDSEMFARMSADHFVILIKKENQQQLQSRLKNICDTLSENNIYDMYQYNLSMSMGVVMIDENHKDIAHIVDLANVARKRGQENSNTSIVFFDNNIENIIEQERFIQTELVDAIINHDFVVYYQPKYEISTNKIIGSEALIRWYHPTHGLISPGMFIPLCEKNGYIEKLDIYVLHNVCAFLRSEIDKGKNPLPVAINHSRQYMGNENYLEIFSAILLEYNIPTNLIEIEITEGIAYRNIEDLILLIKKIHGYGFLLALDDFGSGYSSLNILKDLDVDILKLDCAFMSNIDTNTKARTVVKHVINMAKELGMKVVAEGVETKEQVKFLSSAGCDIVQGYYFAKPMPEGDFSKLII